MDYGALFRSAPNLLLTNWSEYTIYWINRLWYHVAECILFLVLFFSALKFSFINYFFIYFVGNIVVVVYRCCCCCCFFRSLCISWLISISCIKLCCSRLAHSQCAWILGAESSTHREPKVVDISGMITG